jgi:hypothetical protein
MTPKQYLMQAKHLDALIDARLREIDYWRDMSTSISGSRFDGMPHNPNRPSGANFVHVAWRRSPRSRRTLRKRWRGS